MLCFICGTQPKIVTYLTRGLIATKHFLFFLVTWFVHLLGFSAGQIRAAGDILHVLLRVKMILGLSNICTRGWTWMFALFPLFYTLLA